MYMMTNIALILVGQLRTYQKAYPVFHENFIKPLIRWANCSRYDIFFALDRKNVNRSINGSNQTQYITEKDLLFFQKYCHAIYHNIFDSPPQTYANSVQRTRCIENEYYTICDFALQWSYLKEGWKHLCSIEKNQSIEYTIIIKSRPDFKISTLFVFDEININKYVYSFMDQFFFGCRSFMNQICARGIGDFNYYYTNNDCFDNDRNSLLRWNFTSEIQCSCIIREICNEFSIRDHMQHVKCCIVRTDGEISNGPMYIKMYRIKPNETYAYHMENVSKYEPYIGQISLVQRNIKRVIYGLNNHYIDITKRICDYLTSHPNIMVTNQLVGKDPYCGHHKNLYIYVGHQLYILHEYMTYCIKLTH
jgi:hypothetical protein